MKKIISFFKECVAELKKVVWPGKDEILAATKVVFISTIIIGLLLGLVDQACIEGLKLIFGVS